MTEEAPRPAGKRMRRLWNYTWFSLMFLSYLVVLPMIQVAVDDDVDTGPTIALLVAAAIAITQRVRFINRTLRHRRSRKGPTREHVLTFALALAVWAYGVTLQPNALWWSFVPGIVAGSVVISIPTHRRTWVTLVMGLTTGLACLAVSPWRHLAPGTHLTWALAVFSVLLVVLLAVLDIVQLWLWDMVVELDTARATAEELAVTRERLRFAADLHDIQGHHLQAIMLKGELAERLIGRDDDAARTQAAELTELARTALTDTRRVVHAYRGTTLHTEVTNAVDILGAAGIDTEVRGESRAVPPPLQSLFGTLVREGTTNILRHSQATRCELVLETDEVTARVRLVNDGVTPQEAHATRAGSGIESLRERFAALGGDVYSRVVDSGDDATFELGGHAPVRR